ncbi:MAG: DNA polymerase III subunit gamma/tau [Opitutales bacterium]|nr:DNA polymerase III subunit gamma/tau [Opitutales bacterium]
MEQAYQVIARKWRPQVFEDVVGQEHIVRTLQNAIERNRIAHAYLLVGPRGTGKTTTARIFAKALNCEKGPTVRPCNECASCKAITNGSSMDVLEIDGASNNSVDQIRDLRDDVRYAPSQGNFKIYIIDEVHMLSSAAFNALLKTLEEPPAHVKFIFATTEAHKVLPTIVSRCQRFELKPIAATLIAERLQHIAEAENIKVEPAALEAIARLASGGMRDAQSTLDQMIAFCGEEITAQDVEDVYGLLSAERIVHLRDAILQGDEQTILDSVDALDSEGRDFFRALQDIQQDFSGLLVEAVKNPSAKVSSAQVTQILSTLRDAEKTLLFGLSQKVNFSIALLNAAEAAKSRSLDGIIREVSSLIKQLPEDEKKKPLNPQSA